MTYKSTCVAAFGALVLVTNASGALAQNAASTTDPYANTAPTDNDDDHGKWGLVGLLGLAGLLGLKRRDRDDDRRTTGTTRP